LIYATRWKKQLEGDRPMTTPEPTPSASEAFRQWVNSQAWAEHEFNYLVDHEANMSDDLREAVEVCMQEAFLAGAIWGRQNHA
jgi:hypothetical protein